MNGKNKKGIVFRARLRRLRRLHSMTQQEVADYLHLERSSYSYYEVGKTEPDLDTLDRIATLFQVSTDYLLGRKEDFLTEIIIQRLFPKPILPNDTSGKHKKAPPDP